MKRLASLDLVRGIAILCMVIFHVWYYLDDKTSTFPENGNYLMMMMALIFWVFGYWRSFFLFVSAIVVTYSIQKNLKSGARREVVLVKNLFGGLVMYLFAIFRETIVSPEGFLGQSYLARSWTGDFSMLYLFDTLHIIGLSMIIISILQYVLSFREGYTKWIRNSIIFLSLAVVIVSISPLIHFGVNAYFGLPLNFYSNYGGLTQFNPPTTLAAFGRMFWSSLAGWEEPLFPFLATTFVGAMIGVILGQDKPPKKLPRYGYILGFSIAVLGWIVFFATGNVLNLDLFPIRMHVLPIWYYLFTLGLQIVAISFILRRVEFNPKLKKERFLRRTRFIRRWGMLSLTIYSFTILDVVPREIYHQLFGINSHILEGIPSYWSLIISITAVVMWDVIVRLWEKLHFIGSLEWLLFSIKAGFAKSKIFKKDPLNIGGILYDVEPIIFVDIMETQVTPVKETAT